MFDGVNRGTIEWVQPSFPCDHPPKLFAQPDDPFNLSDYCESLSGTAYWHNVSAIRTGKGSSWKVSFVLAERI